MHRIKTICVLIDDTTYIKIWDEQREQHGAAQPLDELAARFTLAGARVFGLAKGDDLRQRLSLPEL